jgi:hypothetical protein
MNLIGTNVFFSTKANMYCHISSLLIKHDDALESRNVWASIVTSLLHFIMIGTKKHDVMSKYRLRPLSLHDASRYSLMVPIETRHAHFLTPLVVDW